MRLIEYKIKSEPARIHVAETQDDLPAFREFIEAHRELLAWDTETTGLDWWNADGRGFDLRLAQFGTTHEAYVLPVEKDACFADAARWALRTADRLIAHNGTYDLHVAEQCLAIPMEELAPRSWDTKLIAHLVDPRPVADGGPGHKLEELTRHYICPTVADEVKASMTAIARELKVKKDEVWRAVPLDHHGFNLYAGTDPLLTARLFKILMPKVPERSRRKGLVSWEHRTAHIAAKYERNGLPVDVAYAENRTAELTETQRRCEAAARAFGVENVNSNRQLVEAFTALGVQLTKKTAKGNLAMDDAVLSAIDHPLAHAVKEAKRAAKWRATWFDRALAGIGPDGKVRASVNTVGARTARMSVSGSIPAQTFPKGSGYVRGTFEAEPGFVIVSTDYSNMELRFLAADANDATMLKAFREDLDLHQMTADASGVPRSVGKTVNFAYVYGSGPRNIAETCGITLSKAKDVIRGFEETYPAVKQFSEQLQRHARRHGYIWTATGRRLPVDRSRPYSALNYRIQSSCRDITARAMIELDRHGYSKWVKLPIHDEILFAFPEDRAEELARETAQLMEFTYRGLRIPAEPEIAGRSWGDLYNGDTKH
ncbi:DNA polymerase [Streptomyces olivoreticuli]|uniref:DNA polymerase n=1 Tax=Streptomyces olivoreticuli TaxID=68246 RepID=UPI002659C9EE|nr:DNA polymerase [Streptomyces olivoreticuli]WKK23058.1 DNA polymerase [Streptomyces olivoreticuli]